MAVRRFTPEGMLQPTPYAHVAVGTGTRHVHVSGQIARAADGTPLAPGTSPGRSPTRSGARRAACAAPAPPSTTSCA